jgi:hypothetical protein
MRSVRSAMTAAVLGLLLAGCLGGSGDQTFADGYYRFVHVSPGADVVAVSANGTVVVPSLQYQAASAYVALAWGTPQITVQSTTGSVTYVDTQVPVAGDAHYSYFLYGGGASTVAVGLRDDVGDAPSGSFYLRGVHLATGIGSLDVYLLAPGTDLATATPAFTALGYTNSNAFTPFTSGTYDIVVTPTATKDVIYDSGTQTFAGNAKVTFLVYATGSGALVNAALMRSDDSGTTTFVGNPAARYKFVNADIDLPAVNFLIDGSVALADLPYGTVEAYAPVAAGSRNLRIEAPSAPGADVYNQNQTMAAGGDQSLVAYGIQGTGSAGLIVLQDNNLPPSSGKAKLRVVNASSDDTAYDLYLNATLNLADIKAATATGYQEVDPTTYTLGFAPTGTTTPTAAAIGSLDPGHVYTAYVFGRNGAAAAELTLDY